MLPATTQFEKFEATFFNFEYPKNVFHLRRPVLDPPAGPLPEPEIHARLVAALGLLDDEVVEPPARGRRARAATSSPLAFAEATTADPRLGAVGAGPAVPHARDRRSRTARRPLRRCGRWRSAAPRSTPTASPAPASATGPDAGDRLFDAIVDSPSGVVFTDDTWEETLAAPQDRRRARPRRDPGAARRARRARRRDPPGDDAEWPLLLSAGERRSFTANTIFRDPAWRKKDPDGALRVSPHDAERIGLADGDAAKLTTKRASAVVTVAVDDTMQPGHVAAAQRARPRPRRGRRADPRPASRRTSSPPARTATRGPARRGTRPCRPGSSRSDPALTVKAFVHQPAVLKSP